MFLIKSKILFKNLTYLNLSILKINEKVKEIEFKLFDNHYKLLNS